MKGFKQDIRQAVLDNNNFRQVLYTGGRSQLVLMTLIPGEEIGVETHRDTDQFFRFESGQGKCVIDDFEYIIGDGDALFVPAGARHNVINTSANAPLKMYTLYSPPHHKDGIVRSTKAEAVADGAEYDGIQTE